MTFDVFWMTTKFPLLRQKFPQQWDWDGFYAAQTKAKSMASRVNRPVGMTLELDKDVQLPPNILLHGRKFVELQVANVYCTAIVTENAFVHHMFSVFATVYSPATSHFVLVSTLAEGLEALWERYPPTTKRIVYHVEN